MADDGRDGGSEAKLSATIGRYAVMAAFTELIPVPMLDSWVQAVVLRGMLEELARDRGVTIDDAARRKMVDPPRTGCLGMIFAVLWWAVKKVIRTILLFLELKFMIDVGVRAWHVGLLLDHLMETGRLTGGENAAAIRKALDSTLASVETRPLERSLRGPYRGAAKLGTRAAVTEEAKERSKTPKTRAERLAAKSMWGAPETIPWLERELA